MNGHSANTLPQDNTEAILGGRAPVNLERCLHVRFSLWYAITPQYGVSVARLREGRNRSVAHFTWSNAPCPLSRDEDIRGLAGIVWPRHVRRANAWDRRVITGG